MPGVRTLVERLLRHRLSTQLAVFGTLVTLVAVTASFVALSLEMRGQTRRLLAETLSRQQRAVGEVERQRLAQLLRSSTLLTDSPTLRAAMETYRGEAGDDAAPREDLLATVAAEAAKVARAVGRDLVVVTDDRGRVLASATATGEPLRGAGDLAALPVVRHALEQDGPVDEGNLAVAALEGRSVRVGAVPIVLQDYVIGALVVGDVLDGEFIAEIGRALGCEAVLGGAPGVIARTPGIDDAAAAELWRASAAAPAGGTAAALLRLGGVEYVTAPIPYGSDTAGRPVTLHLLQSLDGALERSNRTLLLTATLIGLVAVLLAAVAAALVARSLLGPLSRFVDFLHRAAETGDHALRFDGGDAGREVRILAENYNRLAESLERHERELRRRSEEDLERLELLKESEKLAALGRMLSGAAHEINNPLTGVVGNIEMLLADRALSAEARGRLETVRKEGRRIVKLVRNLLKFAHRESDEPAPLDVNQVVRETAALRQHDFATAGIELELDLEPEPLAVSGIELELQQVFLNIVNNALDELRKVERGRLAVRTRREAGRASISFADNGPGIRFPERIFEHFFTTKPVGQGTGLGLSISQAIVQRHGGEISAENPREGGARFTIELPLVAGLGRRAAAVPPASAEEAPPERTLAASVLVVDDEPSVLELQLAILDSLGASAVGASGGAEAVERLRRQEFDLIVSDLRMPGEVSGKDLYAWVEAHRPQCARGFLFVTGDAVDEDGFLERARARCVLKPFTMAEYVRTLQEVLHELRRAA